MISERAKRAAQERFAVRFRRAVLLRIESEHEERVAARTGQAINLERDAMIRTLAAAGQSFASIIATTESKADRVRAVLGLTVADVQRLQLERERARKRPRAASAAR